jgi:trk system potassium uptake protein TrkH
VRDFWKPKPADRIVRHPRQEEIGPVHITAVPRKVPSQFLATPLIITYIFGGLILLGTLLLLLPFAQYEPGFTPFVTALFTATSAITVTGLVVEDTHAYWTKFGQVVIMGLIYVGGLGIMTMATFLIVLIGHRVTLAQRLLVREILLIDRLGGLVRLAIGIILAASAIQFAGFLALFARFYFVYSPLEAAWQAAFHSVSAFNSAGFDVVIEPNGFIDFRTDDIILGTLASLIFVGALSYLVVIELVAVRKWARFTLNTKLVLIFTGVLTLVAVSGFLIPEYQNPDTIGPLSIQDKIAASIFQGVSSRSAGFSIADLDLARENTNLLTSGLMFIGGASASVAGGIKVNTFAVVLIAALATLSGRSHASAFGREIPSLQVQRSLVIGGLGMGFLFLMVLLLSVSDHAFTFLDLLFEIASAFGTVGLSTGITSELSVFGKTVLIITMFVGKLGPITAGLTMAQWSEHDLYRFPQEGVALG